MALTLYGLKTCDTCRKALAAVRDAGKTVVFVDIRADADLAAKLPAWLAVAGVDKLVNTRSTTWRQLSEDEKTAAQGADAAAVLIANPTLIKRPVIVDEGGGLHVGWSEDVRDALA